MAILSSQSTQQEKIMTEYIVTFSRVTINISAINEAEAKELADLELPIAANYDDVIIEAIDD